MVPVMEQLGIGGSRFIPIEELDVTRILNNLEEVWEDRAKIRERAEKALPALRKSALLNASYAASLIKGEPL